MLIKDMETSEEMESKGYAHAAWSSKWYARIEEFELLSDPIPFSVIHDFVTISRTGSRTALTLEQETRLMDLVDLDNGL